VPLSIKTKLDGLAERCKREKVNFAEALSDGLRAVAKTLREKLDARARHRGAKIGASVAPETYPNGDSK
jgi:hypothetical protein